jgi:hypothetical protein
MFIVPRETDLQATPGVPVRSARRQVYVELVTRRVSMTEE